MWIPLLPYLVLYLLACLRALFFSKLLDETQQESRMLFHLSPPFLSERLVSLESWKLLIFSLGVIPTPLCERGEVVVGDRFGWCNLGESSGVGKRMMSNWVAGVYWVLETILLLISRVTATFSGGWGRRWRSRFWATLYGEECGKNEFSTCMEESMCECVCWIASRRSVSGRCIPEVPSQFVRR